MYKSTVLWQARLAEGVEMTDESKWNAIRTHRNELLARCDWTQLIDCPLTESEKEQWRVYRQYNRDITTTFEFPDDVEFIDLP